MTVAGVSASAPGGRSQTTEERMHPWHDLPALADAGTGLFHVVIEIPKGSKIKYELDKSSGLLRVDRILYSSVVYPANYGFVPRSFCEDGDPLDVLVLNSEPVAPLAVIRARPIGLMRMEDEGKEDDKIIAIHVDDPGFADYRDLVELPRHLTREIRQFFTEYKTLEKKSVVVEDFLGPQDATRVLKEAIDLYSRRETELRGA